MKCRRFIAAMEKFWKKDVLGTFPSGDMFVIYPLAFMVGFKLPLHLLIAKQPKRFNVFPYRVVANTRRVLVAVPTINAHHGIELELSELLFVYYC